MKLNIKYKDKKIILEAVECNWFNKFRGLMFRRQENAPILLFDFGKPSRIALHSMFVFFPFLVLWLDDKNKIIELKRVKPWKMIIRPKKPFQKIIEIPISIRNRKIIQLLVGDAKDLNSSNDKLY